jgi:hypothetical protein
MALFFTTRWGIFDQPAPEISISVHCGKSKIGHLVGGLEHEFYDFPYIGNVIIPTDIFLRGVGQPPTS